MKIWKLLPPEKRKQLIIVMMFNLSWLCFIAFVEISLLLEISLRQFSLVVLVTILSLLYVDFSKDTYNKIKQDLKELEENKIENMED